MIRMLVEAYIKRKYGIEVTSVTTVQSDDEIALVVTCKSPISNINVKVLIDET